jgi:hypothetical protein
LGKARRAREHIALLDVDLGPERAQHIEVKVHGPRADRAAARHRDLRLAHARDQGADHPEARAHFRNEMIRRRRIDDVFRRELQGLAGVLVVAGALAADHDVDAVIAENVLQKRHVGEAGHVIEDERLLG